MWNQKLREGPQRTYYVCRMPPGMCERYVQNLSDEDAHCARPWQESRYSLGIQVMTTPGHRAKPAFL